MITAGDFRFVAVYGFKRFSRTVSASNPTYCVRALHSSAGLHPAFSSSKSATCQSSSGSSFVLPHFHSSIHSFTDPARPDSLLLGAASATSRAAVNQVTWLASRGPLASPVEAMEARWWVGGRPVRTDRFDLSGFAHSRSIYGGAFIAFTAAVNCFFTSEYVLIVFPNLRFSSDLPAALLNLYWVPLDLIPNKIKVLQFKFL
ncbi:hypothetical protein C8R46DRAFT_392098 [Mycena filopes]|nr:hypothetical protein C8R46DRAFT_392098 [Mycena filopes]